MIGKNVRFRQVLFAAMLSLCAACSREPTPAPDTLAGMRLGDAPQAGLVALHIPLPSELRGSLVYFTAPERRATFENVALAKPVYAFYRNRLISVMTELANPADAPRLRQTLEAGYGPPLCRQTPAGDSCLWRIRETELVLATFADGQARFLVRSSRLAADVLRWRDQAVPLEQGGESEN